jgi:hypothetical protein
MEWNGVDKGRFWGETRGTAYIYRRRLSDSKLHWANEGLNPKESTPYENPKRRIINK